MTRRIAAVVACVLCAGAYPSITEADSFGIGAISCGQYPTEREKRIRDFDFALVTWVQGFGTAFNFARSREGQTPIDLDRHSVLPYIDKYCRDNPLKDVTEATVALVGDLAPRLPSNTQRKK